MFPDDKVEKAVDTESPDGLEFKPVFRRQPKKRGRLWLSLSYLIVVGLGVGGSWYYFTGKPVNGDGPYVPIIRASLDPVKVRPEKPGGMEVPNRDKLVYERLQGARAKPRVERLLPPAEKPLAPPVINMPVINIETAAGTAEPTPKPIPGKQSVAKAGGAGTAASPAGTRPSPSVGMAPGKPLAKTPTTKEVLAARKPPLPENIGPKTPVAKGATDSGKPGDGEAYRVQLAAVRALDRVKGEWERLRGKNKDLLGTLSLTVSKTDLGPKKGIFYRLRAGPLVDEAKARNLCRKLTARKVGCLIVRPGK